MKRARSPSPALGERLLLIAALGLGGCEGGDSSRPPERALVALSHEWRFPGPDETALIGRHGTEPPEAADALMSELPTRTAQLVGSCAPPVPPDGPELAVALSLRLEEGRVVGAEAVVPASHEAPTGAAEACLQRVAAGWPPFADHAARDLRLTLTRATP